MNEKDSIQELERQASNTKYLLDRLNRAAYGLTFEEMVRLMGQKEEEDDGERN